MGLYGAVEVARRPPSQAEQHENGRFSGPLAFTSAYFVLIGQRLVTLIYMTTAAGYPLIDTFPGMQVVMCKVDRPGEILPKPHHFGTEQAYQIRPDLPAKVTNGQCREDAANMTNSGFFPCVSRGSRLLLGHPAN